MSTTSLVIGLAFLSVTAAADFDLNAGGMWARVLGQSGKIVLAPSDQLSGDPDNIRVEIDSLRELDSSKNELGKGGNSKHSFQSFATQDFEFGNLVEATYQNLSTVMVPFSSTLVAGSKIEIQLFIFKEAGTISLGSESFNVSVGTLKFNVNMSSWAWCGDAGVSCTNQDGTGDALEIDVSVQSNHDVVASGGMYELGGNSQMRISNEIQVDGGAWAAMPDNGPSVVINGKTMTFTIKFPRFASYALYDPDITFVAPATREGSSEGMRTIPVGSWALALCLSVAAWAMS